MVYQGATLHEFYFWLKDSIVGYTQAEILYEKPDASTGFWIPETVDENEGYLMWSPTSTSDLDQAGTWKFQAKITIGGEIIYGRKADYEIYQPIS